MKKIWIDLDGVLVDWVNGVKKRFGKKDLELPKGVWDIVPYFSDKVDYHGFWTALDESFYENLEFTTDAMEILGMVEKAFMVENISLLTAPTNHRVDSATGKLRWIRDNLPSYWNRDAYCVCKQKELLAHSNAILIDDHSENVRKFCLAGGNAILLPRDWNEFHGRDPIEHLKKQLNVLTTQF